MRWGFADWRWLLTDRPRKRSQCLPRRWHNAAPSAPSKACHCCWAWLADVAAKLGRPAEAWHYLTEAARMIEATDARMHEAEVVYKLPGDLLNAIGDQSGAEQHYRQAIAVAERQNAKLLQLLAASSLARLWR